MRKNEIQEQIAADLTWLSRHNPDLFELWEEVDADEDWEIVERGEETLYVCPAEDFALAIYGQSEPRFASWIFEDGDYLS